MYEGIAFDADGVLMNMNANFRQWMEVKYGVELDEDDICHWDFEYIFDIPKKELPEMWRYIWNNPAQPYPGAITLLRDLQHAGLRIYIVSNRPASFYGARRAALRDFPVLGLPTENIHLVDNTPKSEVLSQIKPIAFIEDNPQNATEAKVNWGGEVWLLTRPWNAGCRAVVDNSWRRLSDYDHLRTQFIG